MGKRAVNMADMHMHAYQYTQLVYCIGSPISHESAYVRHFVLSSYTLGCSFQHIGCLASCRYCAICRLAAIDQVLCTLLF